jgi:putative peptidoglycan lipid II flippase
VKVAGLTLAVHAILCAILVGPLRHAGIAMATSISSTLNMLLLMLLLRRRLGPGLWRRELLSSSLRFVLAGGIMALALVGMQRWMPFPEGAGTIASAAWLSLAVAGGAITYGTVHWIAGGRELRDLMAVLPRGRGGGAAA